MNFNEIKQLISSSRERVIIVEDGKPVMVLLSFEDYWKNFKQNPQVNPETEKTEKTTPLFEKKATQTDDPEESQEEKIRLEDLPL
ncbi:MAG: hypothetical protein QMC93_00770 [Patescibacteria group bacterium]|nr:hypothetical protein [Patescibacteria group bacterium]